MEPSVRNNDEYSLSDAASIIKSIDSASNEARTSAITASKEAEEARRNARAASEVARKFMALASSTLPVESSPIHSLLSSFDIRNGSPRGTPQKKQRIPTSPLSNLNGRSPDRSWNNRRGSPVTNPSPSADRLARANADVVVSLTLELDRCKHHVEAEQTAHDETRSLLAQAKARNAQLEAQIERLLNDMETQRESLGRKIDSLEHDLSQAQLRVAAAEEDAQLALDLAKQNNDSRLEVEACLEQTLQQSERLQMELHSKNLQLQSLAVNGRSPPPPPPPPSRAPPSASSLQHSRDAHVRSSMKSVRFAESPGATIDAPMQDSPSKSGGRTDVLLGRQLLQRALNVGPMSPSSNADLPSDADQGYKASVERSQRLQEKIKTNSLEVDFMSPSSVASSVTATPQTDAKNGRRVASPTETVLQSVSSILKASGRRLNLVGRWWNDKGTVADPSERDLETLARHYCTSVEVLLDQKHKEIVELESLCALWENGCR